jgi:outer membrane lipoprotein-sorting protein
MRATLRTFLVFFLSLWFLGWSPRISSAYVLQGPHVLELMSEKLGRFKRLSITQKIVLYTGNLQQQAVEFTETLRYAFPEDFHSEIRSENIHRIHVASKGKAVTVVDGKISMDAEARFDLYKYVLFIHSRRLIQDKLESLGVDVWTSSLGRYQDKLALIVGARYPDESLPQLWVDKETFIPLRWILSEEQPDRQLNRLEVRYLDWGRVKNGWYPMTVEFYQNDVLVRKVNVERVETNPSFSEAIFDIDQLRSTYRAVSPALGEDQKPEGLGEVQKTIDDFENIFK